METDGDKAQMYSDYTVDVFLLSLDDPGWALVCTCQSHGGEFFVVREMLPLISFDNEKAKERNMALVIRQAFDSDNERRDSA